MQSNNLYFIMQLMVISIERSNAPVNKIQGCHDEN